MPERFYNQDEACVLLGRIGRTTLWELERRGLIKSSKIGNRSVYPESEVETCQQRIKAGEASVLAKRPRKVQAAA